MAKIAEPAREAFLYKIWQKNDLESKIILTIDQSELIIRERGIRNFDSGPDFLNALIEFRGEIKRGDVEIHPVAGDWYAHGHHRDPRYNQVILHVVTMDCPPDFKTISHNNTQIPTINLDMLLETSAEMMEEKGEFEETETEILYCELSMCGDLKKFKVLQDAGLVRFNMHVQQMIEQSHSQNWDQLMYRSVLEALGYSKNQIAFRNLADHLPVEILWKYIWNDKRELAVVKCEAFLFGTAGLLPSQSFNNDNIVDKDILDYVKLLETYWYDFPYRKRLFTLKPEMWKFFRLRPQNFPTRRIAAAAHLVTRFISDGFIQSFYKVFQRNENDVKATILELGELLHVKNDGFWSNHFSFEPTLDKVKFSRQLIGMDRIRDILVNVALPALYAFTTEADDFKTRNQVLEIYKNFPPLAENSQIKSMKKQLMFGNNSAKQFVNNVCMQQGMLQLKKFMCKAGDCSVCMQNI